VSYELAWDRLDFESLFTLSASELRDGLDRRGFVAAKKTAYEQQHALRGLVDRVGIDEVASTREAAVVITRVELSDHAVVHNRVELRPTQRSLAGRGLPARAVGRRQLARRQLTREPAQPCWVISEVSPPPASSMRIRHSA